MLISVAVSACAVGKPKPATYVSDRGVTLNADVSSGVNGPTEYWFTYGAPGDYANWDDTPHRTLTITNREPHPVSEPVDGLSANTAYGWKVCVADQQESPPRTVCSRDQSVTTAAAGGRSGIAFVSDRPIDGNQDIFVMDADGVGQTNLTNTLLIDEDAPDWSPDGKRIVFVRAGDLWTMNADGSSALPLTTTPTVQEQAPAWSPDGSRIAFDAGGQIFLMPAAGGASTALTNTSFPDTDPSWSPDGEKVAFIRNTASLRVIRADGTDDRFVRSLAVPQHDPDWSPNRKSILDWVENTLPETGEVHPVIRTFLGEGDTNAGVEAVAPEGTDDATPSWSPDGEAVAYQGLDSGGNAEILLTEIGNPMRLPLTDDAGFDGSPTWSPRPELPRPKLYIAMGDSLTQIGDPQRYPERFFSYLDQHGVADVLHNIGENGQTSGGMNGNQLNAANQYINDRDTDAAVVTIDIGGNDILTEPNCNPASSSFDLTACQPTLDQFSTNFANTLESLNDSLPRDPGIEQVIVMAYFNPWSGRQHPPSQTEADRAERALLGADRTLDCDGTGEDLGLNDRIACIGAGHGAKLADAYPPFIGHGDDYFDYPEPIHPNGTGHQVVANTFQASFEAPGP